MAGEPNNQPGGPGSTDDPGASALLGAQLPDIDTAVVDSCMDPPCVARESREAGVNGLAPMYQASNWSSCSGPSWKSARIRSH